MKVFYRDFRSDEATLIEIREPMKFKDILTCENKYEVL